MRVQNPSRNHHYIPKCLLKHFADENLKVWEYEISTGVFEHKDSACVGMQRDLYTTDLDGALPDYEKVEAHMGKIETKAAPAIDNLIAGKSISENCWNRLRKFLAVLYHRTPAEMDHFRNLLGPVWQESSQRMARYSDEFRSRVHIRLSKLGASKQEVEGLLADLASGRTSTQIPRDMILDGCLRAAPGREVEFGKMSWLAMRVPEGDPDLVIGDHPVIVHDNSPSKHKTTPLGFANPNTVTLAPIGRRMVLVGGNEITKKQRHLPVGVSSLINDLTYRFSRNYIYAYQHSDAILVRAKELQGTGPKQYYKKQNLGDKGTAIIGVYRYDVQPPMVPIFHCRQS